MTSVRRRLLNDRSTVGLLTTSRLGSAGSDHAGAMVDTRLQLLENDVLSASVAATWNETDDAAAIGDAMMARVQWMRQSSLSSQGFTYSAGAKWSGPMLDTWEWDGETWVEAADGGAPARFHAPALVGTDRGVLLFGGSDTSGSHADVWRREGTRWRRVDSGAFRSGVPGGTSSRGPW